MTEHQELSRRIAGQVTILITPYDESGAVDVSGYHEHARFQLERRVDVMVAAGTIGDSQFLAMEERLALVRALAEETGTGGVAVAGIPSDRPQEAIEATAAVRGAGAQAVLVMIPPLLKLTPDEQWAFWKWFDERTVLPFILYSTPHAASGPIGLDLVERVAGLRHVIAIKEAFGDVERYRNLVAAAGDLPVVGAAEKVLPSAIRAGISGFMTASSCFVPELMWHLWLAARDGHDTDDAFGRVLAFRSLFQESMDEGFPSFIPATRAACRARGLPTGAARFPLTDVGPDMYDAIAESVRVMTSAPYGEVPETL